MVVAGIFGGGWFKRLEDGWVEKKGGILSEVYGDGIVIVYFDGNKYEIEQKSQQQ